MNSQGSSSPAAPAGRRDVPMPLWLQGVVELGSVAVVSYLLVLLTVLMVWLADGFDTLGLTGGFVLSGHVWLLAHLTPLQVALDPGAGLPATTGTLNLVPLGLTLVPFALAWHAGRRLARACWEGQFWQPYLSGLAAYAAVGAAAALLFSTDEVAASPGAAAVFPLVPVALGGFVGAYRASRSLPGLIGVNAAAWVERTSQYSRWAGSYVWAVLRAGFVAAVAGVGAGAALLAAALLWNWNDVVGVYQRLGTGVPGDTALTGLQLGYLPNLAVYALAWATGAGFDLGSGTHSSPLGTDPGPVPMLPALAALPPADLPAWALVVVVLPVLAGVLAGWWFLREGENHLDDWMAIRLPARWITFPLSTLLTGLLVGAVAGVLVMLLSWLAHGSLGLGRLTDVGPDGPAVLLWFGAEVAVGAIVGCVVGPWLEHEPSFAPPRGAADEEAGTPVARREARRRRREEAAARRAMRSSGRRDPRPEAGRTDRPADDAPWASQERAVEASVPSRAAEAFDVDAVEASAASSEAGSPEPPER
ncbi:cell division protein PerM [Kocuria kalidii]|uniref:cell division protein PerM n=1 Tax=Kocuria kalidii TaxID=3376283 RepID=UPI0037AD1261